MLSIYHRDGSVKLKESGREFIHTERLYHRRRVGHSGRLNDDSIKLTAALEHIRKGSRKICPNRATNASIFHLDHDFFGRPLLALLEQFVVDRDCSKLILDNSYLLPVVFREDVVQERRLSRAEEPCENGDRNFGL